MLPEFAQKVDLFLKTAWKNWKNSDDLAFRVRQITSEELEAALLAKLLDLI